MASFAGFAITLSALINQTVWHKFGLLCVDRTCHHSYSEKSQDPKRITCWFWFNWISVKFQFSSLNLDAGDAIPLLYKFFIQIQDFGLSASLRNESLYWTLQCSFIIRYACGHWNFWKAWFIQSKISPLLYPRCTTRSVITRNWKTEGWNSKRWVLSLHKFKSVKCFPWLRFFNSYVFLTRIKLKVKLLGKSCFQCKMRKESLCLVIQS